MVVFEVLSSLGLGESLMTAAVFLFLGWYIIRGKSAMSTLAGILGTGATVALGVLVVLAMSVALGWFDPQPGVFIEDATKVLAGLLDIGRDTLGDWLTKVVP